MTQPDPPKGYMRRRLIDFVPTIVAFGLAIAVLGGAGRVLTDPDSWQLQRPEILLPVLLVVGLLVLLLALGGLVALLRTFELGGSTDALGLPAGSIRSVIALSLLLIFSMGAIFLVQDQAQGQGRTSVGLTQAEIQAMPGADRIISMSRMTTFDAEQREVAVRNEAGEPLFAVTLATPPEERQFGQQLSQQLLTLMGTLVTAVVAFYFGATTRTTPEGMPTQGATDASDAAGAGAAGAAPGAAATEAVQEGRRRRPTARARPI